MRVIVRTRHYTANQLRPLVAFVAKHFTHREKAVVIVQDQQCGMTCGGLAYPRHRKAAELGGANVVNLVKVFLPRALEYPHGSRVVPQLPPINLDSWEEDFIVTLAHELRHVDQFNNGTYDSGNPGPSELDAEAFGQSVLRLYREEQAKNAA